jgi:hypothetical protein
MMSGGTDDPRAHAVPGTLRPHGDVVSQRLGDGGVLIDLRSGRIFELNTTGMRVWELITEGCATEALDARLLSEFATDSGRLHAEVRALLDDLRQEGLLNAEPRS